MKPLQTRYSRTIYVDVCKRKYEYFMASKSAYSSGVYDLTACTASPNNIIIRSVERFRKFRTTPAPAVVVVCVSGTDGRAAVFCALPLPHCL